MRVIFEFDEAMETLGDSRYELTKKLATLFTETVHKVNAGDYGKKELEAWAPLPPDFASWEKEFVKAPPFVAIDHRKSVNPAGSVIGFCNLEASGLINYFYVSWERQGLGVASELLRFTEQKGAKIGLSRLFLFSSITAMGFFEKMGYKVVKRNTVIRKGASLVNYKMEKELER